MQKAMVNYHIHSHEKQFYEIDADGSAGKIIAPTLQPTSIDLIDLRHSNHSLEFHTDGLCFLDNPRQTSLFDDAQDWAKRYDRALTDLLQLQLGAKEVIIFDHTVRTDDPNALRKPARNVHSDYSAAGAHQRLKDLVGSERYAQWSTGHFGFVNVWRPVQYTVLTAPLGFVLPRSVDPTDWVELGLKYPDRIGQIMGLVRNNRHEWVYLSKMTPDEVVIFNIFDNKGLSSVAHSAVDLLGDTSPKTIRKSLETRTLIRYT